MISAFIIAKNAQNTIERALKSLTFADEVLVFDDSSEDKTLEIAKKYTGKVFCETLPGDFAQKRNSALKKLTGPWVFFLDADEVVPEGLAEEISSVLKETKASGFWIPRRNYIFGKEIKFGAFWPDYQLRLFQKEKANFVGKVHEKVGIIGKTGYLKNSIIHYNYDNVTQFISKMNHYSYLEAKMNKDLGIKFKWFYLVCWPAREFIRRFVRYQGFRDGFLGLVLACLLAINKLVVALKLWEAEKNG